MQLIVLKDGIRGCSNEQNRFIIQVLSSGGGGEEKSIQALNLLSLVSAAGAKSSGVCLQLCSDRPARPLLIWRPF